MEFESIYLIEHKDHFRTNTWTIPTALFRYGMNSSIEIQASLPFMKEQTVQNGEIRHNGYTFDKAQLGFSLALWEQNSWVPEAALMYRFLVPVENSHSNEIGHMLALNLSHQIIDNLVLSYNFGVVEESDDYAGYLIANLSYDLSPTIHTFIEIFGDVLDYGLNKICLNGGIGFNITPSFCWDFSVARGVNHDMFFVGTNLSYLLQI